MSSLLRVLVVTCLVLIAHRNAFSQLLIETFDYPSGQLTSLNNGANVSDSQWVSLSGTGNPITVSEGSLLFDGYPSSGGGNKIEIKSVSSSSEDACVSFGQRSSGTTYISFLLSVTDTAGLRSPTDSIGDYFVALLPGSSATTFVGRISIRRGLTSGSFQLGIRTTSQNVKAAWAPTDLPLHATHLVVLSYCQVSGGKNDTSFLWINPDLGHNRPPPLVSQSSESASEPSELSRLAVRQDGTDTPDASIDGIRVAVTWEEAPLPIQLLLFSGSRADEHTVQLQWSTQSEVNNYGFRVERSCGDGEYIELANGFLPGGGTTLLPRTYMYTDSNACPGPSLYRLKQSDLDGTVHYSAHIVIGAWTSVPPSTRAQLLLLPNFPNPFNPDTEIQFTVAIRERVRLTVFNILGGVVSHLFDDEAHPGRIYVCRFDARVHPTGVYVYRLTGSRFSVARVMTLLK